MLLLFFIHSCISLVQLMCHDKWLLFVIRWFVFCPCGTLGIDLKSGITSYIHVQGLDLGGALLTPVISMLITGLSLVTALTSQRSTDSDIGDKIITNNSTLAQRSMSSFAQVPACVRLQYNSDGCYLLTRPMQTPYPASTSTVNAPNAQSHCKCPNAQSPS